MDFSRLLDWIRLSPKYLLPIAIFTGFPLFAPVEWLDAFGITEMVERYRALFGLAFLASTTLLLSSGLTAIYEYVKQRRNQAQLTKQLQQRLHRLSEPEKEVLRGYIHNESTTRYLPMTDGVVSGLEAKKIIYRSSNVGHIEEWAYNIQPWAWEYLNSHPELLKRGGRDG